MKILVTGGAGFIGSHAVDAYLAAGHQVAVLDDLSTGSRTNLNPAATFHLVDITDREAVAAVVRNEKPEIISHFAARVSVMDGDASKTYAINVMGTLNVLLASRGIKKFIFISTGGAIYGNLTRRSFTETDPPTPLSAYGVSKLLAEQLVAFYAREFNFHYTILRLANVFGPRQNPHGEAGICAIFCKLIAEGKQPTIYGKDATRDYVYVSDVVDASVRALTKGDGATINIATGEQTTNQQIFDTISAEYQYHGSPIYRDARAGEIERTALDSSLAKKVLDWESQVDLATGIRSIRDYAQKS